MSAQEVEDAVKFSTEDILESVDTLSDHDYCEALLKISGWCLETAKNKFISIVVTEGNG